MEGNMGATPVLAEPNESLKQMKVIPHLRDQVKLFSSVREGQFSWDPTA